MLDDETRHLTPAERREQDGEPCAIADCVRPARHAGLCMDAAGTSLLSLRAPLADYLAIPGFEGEGVSAPTDLEVIEAMRMYGGSFVNALSCAALVADPENLRRIKATWPEYWKQYEDMAARRKASQPA